jgi:hypothetical protein
MHSEDGMLRAGPERPRCQLALAVPTGQFKDLQGGFIVHATLTHDNMITTFIR